jgi:hypothetical protein
MAERLAALRLKFAVPGAFFSPEEEMSRRDAIRREVARAVPGVAQLRSSRLVDRIGLHEGELMIQFDLEYSGQQSLNLESGRLDSPSALLQRDLEVMQRSVKELECEMFLDALGAGIEAGNSTRSERGRRASGRNALMRKYQGKSLKLEFADGDMVVEFPRFPLYRCDGVDRHICVTVEYVAPHALRVSRIRYLGCDDPAENSPGRSRYALLPAGELGKQIGVKCAEAMFAGQRVELIVRTAADYLSGRISHYEVKLLSDMERLMSKSALSESVPDKCREQGPGSFASLVG